VRRLLAVIVAGVAVLGIAGCSGGDDSGPEPRVDLIAPALEAVTADREAEPELLEVSATLEHVDVIVREGGGTGVLYRYTDEGLTGPVEPREDLRGSFDPAEVTVDPERIFAGIRAELDGVAIIDLAIRSEGDTVLIDSTVASEEGGVLLVLLGPEGAILGTQAA
jgi:hypothetical protein